MSFYFHPVKTALGDVSLFWRAGERRLVALSLPAEPVSTAATRDGAPFVFLHLPPDAAATGDPQAVATPPDWVRRIANAITTHLDGGPVRYSLDWLDLGRLTPFRRRVSECVFAIPSGEVRTYGEVACAIDAPRAARAVGGTMANNPFPLIVPCHRVVGSCGLGGFGGGLDQKAALIALEARSRQPASV